MSRLVAASMGLDLGTYLAVPVWARAAESNPLVTSEMAAVALKVAAVLAFAYLTSRFTTRSARPAMLLVVGITMLGVWSNVRWEDRVVYVQELVPAETDAPPSSMNVAERWGLRWLEDGPR